jgi:hypothetical protein
MGESVEESEIAYRGPHLRIISVVLYVAFNALLLNNV